MDTPGILSYALAGVLVLWAFALALYIVCGVRGADRRQRARRAVELRQTNIWTTEEGPIDVTAAVLAYVHPTPCVASVNPDGSVAVARELTENKSVV